jgi:hypothetical protein
MIEKIGSKKLMDGHTGKITGSNKDSEIGSNYDSYMFTFVDSIP